VSPRWLRREQVAKRLVRQHDAGMNRPERIRGWHNLAGGGARLLLVDRIQIRLARRLASERRRPWERRLDPVELAPDRVSLRR
jgi:hypothetical protein